MKLESMLFKAGVATAGTGLYLMIRRLFRKVKKTTEETAENIETKIVNAKKKVTQPRPKKAPVKSIHA